VHPSESNLPRDPATGTVKPGPGRPRKSRFQEDPLTCEALEELFHELGGLPALIRWIKADSRNLAAFYSAILPRLAGKQEVADPGPRAKGRGKSRDRL